ncbi:hypothetical protein Emed_001241 [Eimeria media]
MEREKSDSTREDELSRHLKFGCLRVFKCGARSVNCIRFFGDADHALAGTSDRTVYLLSAQHGIIHEFAGEHTDVVSCVGCSNALPDLVLSGGLDRRGILWSVTIGEAVRQFPRTSPVNACLLRPSPSPLTHVAALGDADGRVRLFDIRSQNNRFGYVQVLADAKDGISSLSLSADETVLLASCVDSSVRLIEASSGECLHAFWGHRQTAASAFRICSDFLTSSRRLPNAAAAAEMFSTDLTTQSPEPPRVLDELLEVVQRSNQSPSGIKGEMAAQLPYAVSGSEDCCVYFWDVHGAAASGEEALSTGGSNETSEGVSQQGVHGRAHEAPTLVVKVDPLSQRLCTAATDGTVKLWRQL